MPRCGYCTEDADGYKTVLDKNRHASIQHAFPNREPVIRIRFCRKGFEFPIRFCPMCGRRLIEDAGTD